VKPSHAANDNLIDRTREFWKTRLRRDLTSEEAREIAENVTGFFGVLAEWARAEVLAAANDAAPTATPNDGEVRHDR
jgi:hypothetical protein